MKVRKFAPVILPKYKFDGTDKDWRESPITESDRPDLPVAYFEEQLQAMGCEVWRTPYTSGHKDYTLKTPCIFLSDDKTFFNGASPEINTRLNAVGLICATLPDPPTIGSIGAGEYILPFLVGHPTYKDPDDNTIKRLQSLDKFAGARLYIYFIPQDAAPYYNLNTNGFTETEIPVTETCPSGSTIGGADGAPSCVPELCTSLPTYAVSHDPTDAIIEPSTDNASDINSDIQLLKDYAGNYDRFKMLIVTSRFDPTTITYREQCGCGFDLGDLGTGCNAQEYPDSREATLGDTSAFEQKRYDASRMVYDQVASKCDFVTLIDAPFVANTYILEMLAMFESLNPIESN